MTAETSAGLDGFGVAWRLGLTLFFVALNGFFVAAEFALVKVRKSRIEQLARDGARAAPTVQHILRMPFYHPVFEEGLRTGLRELAAKLSVTGECRCEDLSEAPGA